MTEKNVELEKILLTNPKIIDERSVSTEEILHLMKIVTAFRVVKEFNDDHAACFHTEITVEDGTFNFMWLDKKKYRRLFYQAEISQVIRDTILKTFLAKKLTKIKSCSETIMN